MAGCSAIRPDMGSHQGCFKVGVSTSDAGGWERRGETTESLGAGRIGTGQRIGCAIRNGVSAVALLPVIQFCPIVPDAVEIAPTHVVEVIY